MFGFQYSPPVISSIRFEQLELSAQNAADNAASALTEVQALFDQVLAYRNESEYFFTQVQQIQEGDYVTTQSLADTLGGFSFNDLSSVPDAFTPSAHTHLWEHITDKPSEFAPSAHTHLWEHITDKPNEFEPAEHAHSWLQIQGKPATFPPEMHYHDWESINNKPSVFNPAAHQHSWGDVTGKPSTFTPSAHTHSWDGITGKPDVFHTENSVNPKLFGMGLTGAQAAVIQDKDLNQWDLSGDFYTVSANNTPPGVSSHGYLSHYQSNNTGYAEQVFSPYSSPKKYWRKKMQNIWGDWQEYLNANTLNFDLFTGNGAHDVIAEGKPFSATTAIFYLDANRVSVPSSISPIGSTKYRIVDTWESTVIADDVSFSSLTLQSMTSKRKIRIAVGALSGMKESAHLELQVKNAEEGFKVNE